MKPLQKPQPIPQPNKKEQQEGGEKAPSCADATDETWVGHDLNDHRLSYFRSAGDGVPIFEFSVAPENPSFVGVASAEDTSLGVVLVQRSGGGASVLVFGARAGRAAAEYASSAVESKSPVLAQAEDERRRLERDYLCRRDGRERPAVIRTEMQEAMERGAGIFRSREGLERAAGELCELRARFDHVALEDDSRTFNTELSAVLELSFMLEVAEAMVRSALWREESRGAHQRTDFPERDDERFLNHSLVYRNPDGSARIAELPVTVTRWPPGERVYGR